MIAYPKVGQVYRHFKGGYYRILAISHDAENDAPGVLIVYEPLWTAGLPHEKDTHHRSWNNFVQEVETKDGTVPRFRMVAENPKRLANALYHIAEARREVLAGLLYKSPKSKHAPVLEAEIESLRMAAAYMEAVGQ